MLSTKKEIVEASNLVVKTLFTKLEVLSLNHIHFPPLNKKRKQKKRAEPWNPSNILKILLFIICFIFSKFAPHNLKISLYKLIQIFVPQN